MGEFIDNELKLGEYKGNFNAQKLPKGIYLYRVNAGN